MLPSAMPLLLLPAQGFGADDVAVAPPATTAEIRTKVATTLGSNAIPLPGGAARLADESRAEVLLSLVRLGGSGRG